MEELLRTDLLNAKRTSETRMSNYGDSQTTPTLNALARKVSPEGNAQSFADIYGRRFANALSISHWGAALAIVAEAQKQLADIESIDPLDESVLNVDWGCPQNKTAALLSNSRFHTIREVADGLIDGMIIQIAGISAKRIADITRVVQDVQEKSEKYLAERKE